jgi:hypothetical protein
MKKLLAVLFLAACSTPTTSGIGNLSDAKIGLPDGSTATSDAGDLPDGTVIDTVGQDIDPAFTCTTGSIACFNDTTAKMCVGGLWQIKEKCSDTAVCQDGNCVAPADCTPNETIGCDGFSLEVHCSADGKSTFKNACPTGQLCADGKCQTVVCTPYSPECTDKQKYHICNPDGQAWGDTVDCKTGAQCIGGKCLSLCETNLKISSNVGCEYWSVDLDNFPDPLSGSGGNNPEFIPHTIVISNPGIIDASITFTVDVTCADGSPCNPAGACPGKKACETPAAKPYDLLIADAMVKAGDTKAFNMPVMNASGTSKLPKGIHVKSDQPIIAWQFNPFNALSAASNDGSLLLPQNVLGKKYYPVSRASGIAAMGFPAQSGYVTIVAAWPGTTTVTITPSANVDATKAGSTPLPTSFPKGKPTQVALQQYDVLNLQAAQAQMFSGGNDLTGTFIDADKPVSVFGGHQEDVETFEGTTDDSCCAEHIEEQFMPLEQWGTAVNCVKTKPRGNEPDHWLIMAGEYNVTLTTNPPNLAVKGVKLNGVAKSGVSLSGLVLAKPGDYIEVETPESFNLTATGKIQATQIIVSRGVTQTFTGDPSMQIVPSPKHYRTDYGILTAQGYDHNYATVVRPVGLAITLDGQPIDGFLTGPFTVFGDGTWEYAYVDFKTGAHNFAATSNFGLQVYGYGNATAYSYPGGMNLEGAAATP